jgi:hypothetical protein
MFFSISENLDKTFPYNTKLGKFWINHDEGWSIRGSFLYKGITNHGILKVARQEDIESYKDVDGNFCIIFLENEKIKLTAGIKQKFPMYQNQDLKMISNLYKTENNILAPFEFDGITVDQIKNTQPCYKDLNISDEEIISRINDILEKTFLDFTYDKPFKLYITGVDTILIAAYVLKNKIPFELVSGEHAEMDYFLCHHRSRMLKDFWAYSTIQHWKTDNILFTGALGDETMLRDAVQAKIILDYYGENIVDICTNNPDLYHSYHFLKKENMQAYKELQDLKFTNEKEMKNYIVKQFFYDYQHWHLGRTIFFSPYDNMEILNLALNLSYETARKQLLDASVSKELILRTRPALLKFLSKSKNFNYYENLCDLYSGSIKLESL